MKENLDDLIQFENENSYLDFKAIQYKKENNQSLLKDLMAMANAKTDSIKYIITGVKLLGDGSRNILGIEENIIDEATYQQLIYSNIEPELDVSYFSYQFQDKKLGVFRIAESENRPYMMKKTFKNLSIGDSFIRKGSQQTRLTRKDIDFYMSQKILKEKFNGKVYTYFNNRNKKTIQLDIANIEELPSNKAKKEIELIIQKKKKKLSEATGISKAFINRELIELGGTAYTNRSIETLEDNLKNIRNDYFKDDKYYHFELNSNKFNFQILNDGNEYLEDVTIELRINKQGISIPQEIIQKPEETNFLSGLGNSTQFSLQNMHYPNVEESELEYIITEDLGDLKHQLAKNALKEDLRIVIYNEIINSKKKVKIKIFAKNLIKPIQSELEIIIGNPSK